MIRISHLYNYKEGRIEQHIESKSCKFLLCWLSLAQLSPLLLLFVEKVDINFIVLILDKIKEHNFPYRQPLYPPSFAGLAREIHSKWRFQNWMCTPCSVFQDLRYIIYELVDFVTRSLWAALCPFFFLAYKVWFTFHMIRY